MGIGEAIARDLAGAGHRVFGTVRREEDGERLSTELGAAFTALLMDVTDVEAIGRAASRVEEELGGAGLAGLVAPFVRRALKAVDDSRRGAMPVSVVVDAVREGLFAPRPRERYVANHHPWVRKLLLSPTRWVDRVLAAQSGLMR